MNRRRSLLMIAFGFVFAALFLITGNRRSASAQSIAEGWQGAFYGQITTQGSAPANPGPHARLITTYATYTSITLSPAAPHAGQQVTITAHVTAYCGGLKCPTIPGTVTLTDQVGSATGTIGTQPLVAGTALWTAAFRPTCYEFWANYSGGVNINHGFAPSQATYFQCFAK